MDLSDKKSREALPARKEPYWQRLNAGAYLGFRRAPPGKRSAHGRIVQSWHARFRDREGKQNWKPLGEGLKFDEAKKQAEEWFAQLEGPASRAVRRDTVRAALETYLADLRRHMRHDAADEAEGRFKLCVWKDPIAERSLESMRKQDFQEWRDRLTAGRQPRTVNRHVRSVVAGLNCAAELGHVGNPAAWTMQKLIDDREDESTAVFLDPGQRAAILKAAPRALADLLRGLELTGARPKEIAVATVADFDGETIRLSHKKGRPPKLRTRYTVLDAEGVRFFKAQSRDKLPAALLCPQANGEAWYHNAWAKAFRKARAEANKHLKGAARIPLDASAYSFRHARISELLQVHGIDPVTTAAQTGTSVAMIEKTYLKFIPHAMREKLAAVRPEKRSGGGR